MTFHFIRPMVFLLLPIVILVWWFWRSAMDPAKGWSTVMEPELLKAMMVGRRKDDRLRGIGRLVAWSLALLSVAGPTWRPEPSPFADDPLPVMILLKADESMNTDDFLPSRMELARLKVVDFAKARGGRPLGLIAYAGSAHLVLPPTRDTEVVGTMAGHIGPDIMPEPGNNLAAGIRLAEEIMSEGAIVVIADSVPMFESKLPVHVLAVSRSPLKGMVMISADSTDIDKLIRKTKETAVAAGGEGAVRWAETGWWLLPILGVFVLFQFRRTAE